MAFGTDERPPASLPNDDCTLDGSDVDDPLLRAMAETPVVSFGGSRLPAGTVIDGTYRVLGVLGAGAMGVVYEAVDLALDRRVAVKLHEPAGAADRNPRVWREARAMARLSDPHVVTVYEVGAHEGRLFIAMELVDGSNARVWLGRSPRTWREVLDIYLQAAKGLAAAHAVGIVHRDFKPDNVLVGRDGRVRVADFGLARGSLDDLSAEPASDDAAVRPPDDLTRTGAMMGTPAYVAPERLAGRPADAASDQFSFCVALHEALWGMRPFAGDDMAEMFANACAGRLQSPADLRGAPKRIYEIVRRGLSVDPTARHPDIDALARALADDPARRWRRVAVAAAIALPLAAWATTALTRTVPCEGVESSIAELWNPARADEITAAFVATGFPEAEVVAGGVRTDLEGWTSSWGAVRREACEATRVRGEQSEARMELTIDCLDRARRRARLLLDSFAGADAAVVEHADAAIDALPPASACADAEALARIEPVQPQDVEAFAALRQRIDAAAVEQDLGRARGVRDEIEALVVDADRHAVLSAEALVLRGRVQLDERRPREAAEDFAGAVAMASRAGAVDLEIDAMTELAHSLGGTAAGTDEALRWLSTAEARAVHAAWSPDRIARIEITRADVCYLGDRHADAEAAARRALAGAEHPRTRGRALTALGNALERQRHYAEAIEAHREAVALLEGDRGPRHPAVARALINLAIALEESGAIDESVALTARAVEIREAAFGPDALVVAAARERLASSYQLAGELDRALAEFERALAIQERATPRDDDGWVHTAGNMAGLLGALGRGPEALALLERVGPVAHRLYGEDSLRVAELLHTMAVLEENRGDTALALEHAEDAERIFVRHLGPDDRKVAGARMILGSIHASREDYDEALRDLEEATRILATAPEVPPRDLAFAIAIRADVLAHAGRRAEALETGAQAVAAFERAYPTGHPELARVLSFQATLLSNAKREKEAIPLFERALAMIEGPDADPALRAEIEAGLARAR